MIIELEVEGQTGSWKNHSELCCLFEVFSIDRFIKCEYFYNNTINTTVTQSHFQII